jgi:hypothetical protein
MTNDERLADLLLAWEDDFEQGQDVPAEDLCRDCIELTAALAARISALRKVAWVKQSPRRRDAELAPVPSPSSPGPLTLGERYRLDGLIAKGGFGEVWRGFDLELQRPVAVKLPHKRSGKSEDEEAFLSEARKVARLKHPGIVPVYDVGRHEGAYFIVSELVEGQDVAERLRANPFSIQQAVRIVAAAAHHLHHAHQQGFIHRDIKPANLLMDAEDQVYITDFGIALTEAERHESGDGSGTLAYMSPEQLHGDPARIDPRTDLYSLGVVLYQLLAGRLPFEAETPETMRDCILREEPVPPRRFKTATPREIERICLKCLAKSPANRYPTAEALADDLTGWLKRRKTSWLLAGAGLAGCLLVGWLGIARPFVTPSEWTPDLGLAANPPAHRLEQERALFNGRDTDGWDFISREYDNGGQQKKARLEEAIRVEDGVLHCREEPRYWLYTREAYSDFVLRMEYRFPYKPKWGTGSAVLLRMSQPGPHHDAHVRVRLGGWATARILQPNEGIFQDSEGIEPLPGLAKAERPTGEWNELSIACVGGGVAVRVNGMLVNQVHLAMAKEGRIGLAPMGCAVGIRKVALARVR